MSLQVWLPLNGDLHNQGLAPITFSTITANWNTAGKIGKAFSTLNSNVIGTCPNLNGVTTFSLTFWCFPKTNSSITTSWCNIIALGSKSADNSTSVDFRFESSYGNTYILSHHNNVGEPIGGGTTSLVSERDKWYHIAVVANNEAHTIRYYVNGVQLTTSSFLKTHNGGHLDGTIKLANENIDPDCLLNDVRIYDHALSTKEVEEISKGLILHYKLDNDGFGNENYWGDGKPFSDWSASGELSTMYSRTNGYATVPKFIPNEYIEIKFLSTRTPIDDGGIQLQKLQRYNTTINGMCSVLEHLKTGEHLTISYELYITSPIRIRFHLIKTLNGTSTKVQPNIESVQVSTLNTWTKVSQSVEIPSSFDESNITTESVLGAILGIREILGTTSSGEVIIRIRNIKIEQGSVATNWTPARADFGHIDDNVIYDYSGYGNNGTKVGSLEAITPSPRYDYATYFDGDTSGILIENLQLSNIINDKITYSFWINPNGENGARSTYFGSYSATSWSIEKTTGNTLRLWWNGSPDETATGASITDGIWQHICVVKNGTNDIKVYINGIQKWASTATHSALNFPTTYRIGRDTRTGTTSYHGNMSDFRIYATALTAEQVKELYNTSTTIDKNGNIYARELVEI